MDQQSARSGTTSQHHTHHHHHHHHQQQQHTAPSTAYTRQATILRKNLLEWDAVLHNPRGEDWPTMLGRLNAAFHQTTNLNNSIDDILEHFVYVPKQCTANAQDIPFFLSTRLDVSTNDDDNKTATDEEGMEENDDDRNVDPVDALAKFESKGAQIAAEYEEKMVRF
jgi:hypothetical protein